MIAEKCVSGRCTACGVYVWRTATAARNNGPDIRAGDVRILWPLPDSVYARLETPEGEAPGVAFCAEHRPEIGALVLEGYGPVVRIESAHDRYERWYSDEHGIFRGAWLRDALSLPPYQVDELMRQWQADRPLVVLGR